MAQVVDFARVGSKLLGAVFFVIYLLEKEDRERKMELLVLATFCMAVI